VLYDCLLMNDIFQYDDIYDDLMAYLKMKMAMMMNNVDKDHLLILASSTWLREECVRKSEDEEYIEYQLIILSDGHFVQTRWLLLRRLTNYPMYIQR
jgi:hypothetical protein